MANDLLSECSSKSTIACANSTFLSTFCRESNEMRGKELSCLFSPSCCVDDNSRAQKQQLGRILSALMRGRS